MLNLLCIIEGSFYGFCTHLAYGSKQRFVWHFSKCGNIGIAYRSKAQQSQQAENSGINQ